MVKKRFQINLLFWKIFLFFVSVHSMSGCGAIWSDQFSESIGLEAENGYLLRGSGWADWKYGYVLNDVNQIETVELIAAVQINNHRQTFWGIGPILPVLPTLGLITEGYDGKISDKEKGLKVTIALYGKTDKDLVFDPCKIILTKDHKTIHPIRFNTTFQESEHCYSCSAVSNSKDSVVPGRANDIFFIELFYLEETYPEDNISVSFPAIDKQGISIQLDPFKFKKGRGTFWTIIL